MASYLAPHLLTGRFILDTDQYALAAQPTRLVLLSSKLERLGPSTPWRYHVGHFPQLECQPCLFQPHLSWQHDAGTQTLSDVTCQSAAVTTSSSARHVTATDEQPGRLHTVAGTAQDPQSATQEEDSSHQNLRRQDMCEEVPTSSQQQHGHNQHSPNRAFLQQHQQQQPQHCSSPPAARPPSSEPWVVLGRGASRPWKVLPLPTGPWVPPGTHQHHQQQDHEKPTGPLQNTREQRHTESRIANGIRLRSVAAKFAAIDRAAAVESRAARAACQQAHAADCSQVDAIRAERLKYYNIATAPLVPQVSIRASSRSRAPSLTGGVCGSVCHLTDQSKTTRKQQRRAVGKQAVQACRRHQAAITGNSYCENASQPMVSTRSTSTTATRSTITKQQPSTKTPRNAYGMRGQICLAVKNKK